MGLLMAALCAPSGRQDSNGTTPDDDVAAWTGAQMTTESGPVVEIEVEEEDVSVSGELIINGTEYEFNDTVNVLYGSKSNHTFIIDADWSGIEVVKDVELVIEEVFAALNKMARILHNRRNKMARIRPSKLELMKQKFQINKDAMGNRLHPDTHLHSILEEMEKTMHRKMYEIAQMLQTKRGEIEQNRMESERHLDSMRNEMEQMIQNELRGERRGDSKRNESNEYDASQSEHNQDHSSKEDSNGDDSSQDDSNIDDSSKDDSDEVDSSQADSTEDDIWQDEPKEDDLSQDDSKEDNSSQDDKREYDLRQDYSTKDDPRKDDSREYQSSRNDSKEKDAMQDDMTNEYPLEDDSTQHESRKAGQLLENSKQNELTMNESQIDYAVQKFREILGTYSHQQRADQ